MIVEETGSHELLERKGNTVANGVGVFDTASLRSAKRASITDIDGKE